MLLSFLTLVYSGDENKPPPSKATPPTFVAVLNNQSGGKQPGVLPWSSKRVFAEILTTYATAAQKGELPY